MKRWIGPGATMVPPAPKPKPRFYCPEGHLREEWEQKGNICLQCRCEEDLEHQRLLSEDSPAGRAYVRPPDGDFVMRSHDGETVRFHMPKRSPRMKKDTRVRRRR